MCVGSADLDGDGGNDLAVIHDRGVSVLPNVSDIPVPTAVSEQAELSSLVPEAYSLSQNFPNPFNSDTVIRLALPTSEDIELSIFNLAGQKVATLVQGVREAGTYTVRWDGRDDDGRALASGVYVYRLRAGEQEGETRKLLLLR